MKYKKQYLIAVVVAVSVLIISSDVALARTAPNNTIEAERKALCSTSSPINIYGAVWINGSSTTSWAESITVPWDATTVRAYMQTTVFACSDMSTATRSGIQIINLASNNGGTRIPIVFDSGTTVNRGDVRRGEFSSTGNQAAGLPGILPITLNIGTRATGSYTVSYTGRYRDENGTGLESTYYTTVNLVREPAPPDECPNIAGIQATVPAGLVKDASGNCVAPPPPPTATIAPSASVTVTSINANSGGTASFTNQATVSGAANTNSATFSYSVTASASTIGATWDANNSASGSPIIEPDGAKVTNSGSSLTVAAGSTSDIGRIFCRTITISGEPDYVTFPDVNGNGEDGVDKTRQACVRIVGTNITLLGGNIEHEIGSGDRTFSIGIAANSMYCVDGPAIGEDITLNVFYKGGTSAITSAGSITVKNCQLIPTKEVSITISGSVLDPLGPGGLYPVQTIIRTSGGADIASGVRNIEVFSAPYTRFYGNDVLVCGSGPINRFVYDERGGSDIKKGSYTQYASIYKDTNEPQSAYSGLHSGAVNDFNKWWDGLLSNWDSPAACDDMEPEQTGIVDDPSALSIGGDYYSSSKITFYKETGDIVINRNIYLQVNPSDASDPTKYPVVLVYAKNGNIIINGSVAELNAVLLAPNGTIDTCNSPLSDIEVNCANQLRVNGALVANTVKLKRTWGTRYLADSVNDNQTAEIIRYPWYMYYAVLQLPDTAATRFDAYYSLPPRL